MADYVVGSVTVAADGTATGTGLAYAIHTQWMSEVPAGYRRAMAPTTALHATQLATAILGHIGTNEFLKLNTSNDPMQGNLDLGAYNLDNFYTDVGSKTALTGGGSLTTILTYATGLAQHEIVRVGVEVTLWEQSTPSVYGQATVEATVYGDGSGIEVSKTNFDDTSGLPGDSDVALSDSSTNLLVQAKATANNCYAIARLWHQPKYDMDP